MKRLTFKCFSGTLLDIQRRLDVALAQQPSSTGIDSSSEINTPVEDENHFSATLAKLTRTQSVSTDETELSQFSFTSQGGSSFLTEISTQEHGGRSGREEAVPDLPDINTVIGDAHKVLKKCTEEVNGEPTSETKSTPVFDPPHPDCVIDSVTAQRFETAARLQRAQSNITLEEWLRNATWWLVKVPHPFFI